MFFASNPPLLLSLKRIVTEVEGQAQPGKASGVEVTIKEIGVTVVRTVLLVVTLAP